MTSTRKASGSPLRWGLPVVLVVLAGLLGLAGLASRTGGFNAELWQAQRGASARDNPRAGMVVDLQRVHLRAGMSRAEVQRLLGEPDQQQEFSDVYELGVSPVGIDYEYFIVDYDASGAMTQSRIARD